MTKPMSNQMQMAITAVQTAARICQMVQKQLVTEQTLQKADRSPVTVADFASQAVVCAMLAEHFPNDPMVAEENSQQLRQGDQKALCDSVVAHVAETLGQSLDTQQVLAWIDRGGADASSDRYWTLDPIDGTKGFLRRQQYAIALALIESGEVVLGVLGCPNLATPDSPGALLVAEHNCGAHQLPIDGDNLEAALSVKVDDVANASEARFCESVESAHSNLSQSAQIAQYLGIGAEPVRIDSQAKYATVARGDASIYMRLPTGKDYREKIWDHAAGTILVHEAGGRVTDIDGQSLQYTHGRELGANRGVLATNGYLHDTVLDAIKTSTTT